MRLIITAILLSLCATPLLAVDELQIPQDSTQNVIDSLLSRAISQNLIAGGVVVIGNREGVISTIAQGQTNASIDAPFITEKTIFDIASLTKVIATAPAVMKLLEEGRIALMDPIARWFPELKTSPWEDVTILNLLTHTSGLKDIELRPDGNMETAISRVASQQPRLRSGAHFRYADINFILLGELVSRVSGKTLDTFCHDHLYAPLGAQETSFLPSGPLIEKIAPTPGLAPGTVQDGNARRLGGVAGHAGLFSSASDLALYARLILGGGAINGKRILSKNAVAQMTAPYSCSSGAVRRGLGWDMDSPYSAPKGSFFSEASFGHTGYSGSSIWIDPRHDLFVVLLTIRTNYRDIRAFNQLRRDVSSIAAAGFRELDERQELALLQEIMQPEIDAGLARRANKIAAIQITPAPLRPVKQSASVHKTKRSSKQMAAKKQTRKYAKNNLKKKEKRLARASSGGSRVAKSPS